MGLWKSFKATRRLSNQITQIAEEQGMTVDEATEYLRKLMDMKIMLNKYATHAKEKGMSPEEAEEYFNRLDCGDLVRKWMGNNPSSTHSYHAHEEYVKFVENGEA